MYCSHMFIKIKLLMIFLKRLITLSFLPFFGESICSRVILVWFIPELTEICELCHIHWRSGWNLSFFNRFFFVFCLWLLFLLCFSLSSASDLASHISDYPCTYVHESIYEVDENCEEQETGEHPSDLKLQVRQKGLVVKYLGVQVVREHEGQVEITGDCHLIHKG